MSTVVTYAELRSEQVYRDMIEPPNLVTLRKNLQQHWPDKGMFFYSFPDNRHLRGYHLSRAWIEKSRFCTDRHYSVTETAGNRGGGDPNWTSAIDLVVGQPLALSIAHKVNVAKQRGDIGYIREVIIERDPWHCHLSLDRAHANDNHDTLFRIITGTYALGENTVDLNVTLPVLKNGSSGGFVLTAQHLLIARGCATAPDGDFGEDTEKQTKAMQSKYGAEKIDGVWGPETWTIGITGEDRR